MARLSEARKEARALLQRAKSAPVKGGARTKLEKRAGSLLRGEPLQGLNAQELRARAKTYLSGYGARLEAQAAQVEAAAKALRAERDKRYREKKKAKREEKKREEEKARELAKPFGVVQEYAEGLGTGDLVRQILETAKGRPWCLAPVTIDLKANLGVGDSPRKRFTTRIDLARLTNAEGEVLAVQIHNWIWTELSTLLLKKGEVVQYPKRKNSKGEKASTTPENAEARAMLETGIRGTVEAFVAPLEQDDDEERAFDDAMDRDRARRGKA
jgi:hypothetical protein